MILNGGGFRYNYVVLIHALRFDMTESVPSDLSDALAFANVRLDRLRVRHLRLLDWTERAGSLSAAASNIGVSQPAATKMLQEIEAAFGCRLYERTARGGHLNAAGMTALHRLRVAIASVQTAWNGLKSGTQAPVVRLGILPLATVDFLPQVVATLEARQDPVKLVIRVDTGDRLFKLLLDGELDCAVCALGEAVPEAAAQLQVRTLWTSARVLVAAADHPLVRRKAVPLEATLAQQWILMPSGSNLRTAVDKLFFSAGLSSPSAAVETDSFHVSLAIAARTRMLTVVPLSVCRAGLYKVKAVSLAQTFPSSTIALVTLRGVPAIPAVEQLGALFAAHARRLVPAEAS